MRRCTRLTRVFPTLFLSVILVLSLCGRGHAGEGDDLVAKLLRTDVAESPAAIAELIKAADDQTVHGLMKVVEQRRDDWKLQISAIRLLGEIADPAATDLLIKVVTDPFFTNECPALKWNGIIALGNFRDDSRVVDALLHRWNEDTLYLREAVIQSLGQIGNREALPYLISALEDKHFAVRMSAVRALEAMNDPGAIPFLRRIAKDDSDLQVRDEALKALDLLK